ncbi:PREDICTED: endonuclease V [Chrysochloris asiatica]|uniref:Endonuclease V n=1 Tax=Chrysochloris asiatica TaxID=185453 RepID=A0A9B0WUY0_CHRAS|nr:PREDICTED: endonuclease V [Chrysochloris asiatica]
MAHHGKAERPPEETLSLWKREQARLKARVINWDTEAWQRDADFSGLQRVGGVDVSFVKGDGVNACASLVVLNYPELEVVYEECRMVSLEAPYVSGFLAFREVSFLEEAVQRLREKEPGLVPQVLLVDGNGVLHHQGFGIACHLGVLTDLPCVGVAKKLLHVDGLEKSGRHKEKIKLLQTGGDTFPLVGDSGTVLGMALKSNDRSTNPLYVSVGHKVSLETAVRLTRACCRFRSPEPVRQADIRSREYIRRTHGPPGPPTVGQERTGPVPVDVPLTLLSGWDTCPRTFVRIQKVRRSKGKGKPPEYLGPLPGAHLDTPTQGPRDSEAWAGGQAEPDTVKTQGPPELASGSRDAALQTDSSGQSAVQEVIQLLPLEHLCRVTRPPPWLASCFLVPSHLPIPRLLLLGTVQGTTSLQWQGALSGGLESFPEYGEAGGQPCAFSLGDSALSGHFRPRVPSHLNVFPGLLVRQQES